MKPPFDEQLALAAAAGRRGRPALVFQASTQAGLKALRRPSASTRRRAAFSAPRFQGLYRAWLERGDPVLEAPCHATLADAHRPQDGPVGVPCSTHIGISISLPWSARRNAIRPRTQRGTKTQEPLSPSRHAHAYR